MNKLKHIIYNYPKGTYLSVNIEEINHDLQKMKKLASNNIFENTTSLHHYFTYLYTDPNGNELYSYDDIRRFLGKKEGGVSHEKGVTLAEEFGIILQGDEGYYLTNILDVLKVMEYQQATNIKNYLEPMNSVEDILLALRDILLSLESSQHYNYIPNTDIDGFDFFNEWIFEIDRAIFKVSLGNIELKNKLKTILEEFKFFIHRYEIPGVVPRWKEINPKLTYFDAVYTIMNENPDLYESIKNGNQHIKFSIYPSYEDLNERNHYFETIENTNRKNNYQTSEHEIFQHELEHTWNLIIDQDLKHYLNQG